MGWQEKYALIIDEVSMLGVRTLYVVNDQLCRIRESSRDFGGIPVVLFLRGFPSVSSREREIDPPRQLKSYVGETITSVRSSDDNTTWLTFCEGSSPRW
ncbi:hypothetical protein GGTG_13301 [Gaeumannomyces tritici R3-111a-1]|uniref:Uncharacterized protein n=1 Tax=Gaeumannomyces tritici (strain R3-111a-1) TaxID=644352 RepID=J3PIH3_GAET3|nr:hypothetical protein GGTG_13301 [Gaeumannomyces tritici R3-111a-1]EJT69192.1 hypothetical protein GGTG_13301 [Gaeumannomyces tritici R3-111a-1]